MALRFLLTCVLLLTAPLVTASPSAVTDTEALAAPTPARIAEIHTAAQRDGWLPQQGAARAAARRAYERDKLAAAEAWLNVARWCELWGETETVFVPRWLQALHAAKVGHSNMPTRYEPKPRPLGASLSSPLQAWLLGNAAFAAEFFNLVTPVDYLPRVLGILDELYRADPVRFKTYADLALAIAVVYDVPPPPIWPHAQVAPTILPRQFPAPLDAFTWWIKQEQKGRLFHRLARLRADELVFVVDVVAPFPELEWAQTVGDFSLNQLPRAYSVIRYRRDRLTKNQLSWPAASYSLPEILTTGGICPDQAYFATMVGKARGVPTLLIYGAGNDGRHAWFGYLDGNRTWQLDAGRYAEQRFVTGYARDPQTWREFSDHELKFLSERFHQLPSYQQSHVHELFAAEYLRTGDTRAAAIAARKAVNFERRNQAGWDLLLAAARNEGRDAKAVEAINREAALAFQRYPDLEAHYASAVAASLRARGETSSADAESRRIATKNQAERGDLSVQAARDIVQRAMATQPLPEQVRAYQNALDTYGRGAGMTFFDAVVVGFVQHLVQLEQRAEAVKAVDRARRTLRVEPGTQLAHEFDGLARFAAKPAAESAAAAARR